MAEEARSRGAVATSATTGFGIDSLVRTLQDTLVRVALVRVEIDVPYDSGGVIGEVRKAGVVESETYWQGGTRVVAHVPSATARRLAHLAVTDSSPRLEDLEDLEDLEAGGGGGDAVVAGGRGGFPRHDARGGGGGGVRLTAFVAPH